MYVYVPVIEYPVPIYTASQRLAVEFIYKHLIESACDWPDSQYVDNTREYVTIIYPFNIKP